ncbi:MAG TPA: helical backbone metal receptor [Polyangiaceae bacterium]|nr:helical backbone metal receptor [Polyangiaceae bacterium]
MKQIRLRDDRKRLLQWPSPPARVVSLVPSDTYSIIKLGAKDRLIGRTRYCVAPEADVASIPTVGGTKDADIERILELKPDAVIANQEENSKPDIERLEAEGLRVLVSFPKRVDASVAHLARLAVLLDLDRTRGPAKELVSWAYKTHTEAQARRRDRSPVRAFAPIWMSPLMTVHGDTFISDLLDLAGAQNVFADRPRRYPLAADLGKAEPLPPERALDRDTRYPRVTLEEIEARKPEIVLLPDEPHPFTEADADTFRALDIPAAKRGMIVFCDGKDLMWYGARSLEGLGRITALIDAARAA